MQPTWEVIVQPQGPIPLSSLEIVIARGESFSLPTDNPILYQEVISWWDQAQVRQTLARSKDLTSVLGSEPVDKEKLGRMMHQIAGNNQKLRLTRAVLDREHLYLAVAAANYMDFIGTNERAISDPAFRERLMSFGLEHRADPNHYFANPLAVCTVLYGCEKGSEGKPRFVPVGLRSDKVMIYPNVYHMFGGLAGVNYEEEKPIDQIKTIDLDGHARHELKGEIGLTDEEMGETTFFGIIRQSPSRHPEAILGLPIYLEQDVLVERWRNSAPGKFEHRRLEFLEPANVASFLEEHGSSMVPSGAAALNYFQHNVIEKQ